MSFTQCATVLKISHWKKSENNVENIKVPLYKLTAYPCLEYYVEFCRLVIKMEWKTQKSMLKAS